MKRGAVVGLSLAVDQRDHRGLRRRPGGILGSTGARRAPRPPPAHPRRPVRPTGGIIRVATQRPAAPLDPIAMQDLVELRPRRPVVRVPARPSIRRPATSGRVWPCRGSPTTTTASGRSSCDTDATWHDGSPFTADDVVATMDRLAAAGNAGPEGRHRRGLGRGHGSDDRDLHAARAPTATSRISCRSSTPSRSSRPVAYETGTTAGRATRPGPAPGSSTTTTQHDRRRLLAQRRPGGAARPRSTAIEFSFFDETGPMVTAYQGGQIDAIVQFDVNSGRVALQRPELQGQRGGHDQPPPDLDARGHRPVHRQARPPGPGPDAGSGRDDPAAVQGPGPSSANDHVIFSVYPYFDESVSRSGRATSTRPSSCSPTPARRDLTADLHVATAYLEIADLAVLLQEPGRRRRGSPSNPAVESLGTFYGAQWCPAEPADPPCSGAAELGIVDYGHRATPDVFLNAALATKGIWNSSQYTSAGVRRRVRRVPGGRRRRRPEGRVHEDRDDPHRGRPDRDPVHLLRSCRVTRRSSAASTRARSGRCSSRRHRRPDRSLSWGRLTAVPAQPHLRR